MKKVILIPLILIFAYRPAHPHITMSSPGVATHAHKNMNSLGDLLQKEEFEKLFPHHHRIYSYENLMEASKRFPLFAAEGNLDTRKKELAAFLANIAHETGSGCNGTPGAPMEWGLYYSEETACCNGPCAQYNISGMSRFHPVPGKSYFGRGAIQLSYAYNYGLAGEELQLPLLEKPELVSNDGVVAFETAFWFWMRAQRPKPSCHDVMCGSWVPGPVDAHLQRKPGFGMTMNIINGGVECNSDDQHIVQERRERIDYYKMFADAFQVKVEDNCECRGMAVYD